MRLFHRWPKNWGCGPLWQAGGGMDVCLGEGCSVRVRLWRSLILCVFGGVCLRCVFFPG